MRSGKRSIVCIINEIIGIIPLANKRTCSFDNNTLFCIMAVVDDLYVTWQHAWLSMVKPKYAYSNWKKQGLIGTPHKYTGHIHIHIHHHGCGHIKHGGNSVRYFGFQIANGWFSYRGRAKQITIYLGIKDIFLHISLHDFVYAYK